MKSKKRELTVKEKAELTAAKLELSLNKMKGFMFDYYFSPTKAIQLDNKEFANELRSSKFYARKLRHLGVSSAEELLMLLEPLALTRFGADDYGALLHDISNIMVDIEDEIISYL